jgi:hypothetical protein
MNALPDVSPTLADHLAEPIRVGEPATSGPLAVYPLYGPPTTLDYAALATADGQVAITELEGGASVNDLTVKNSSDRAVLLYEGEEILGAQQNRVLDVSILLAAGSETRIPVSCVEQGRWDGARHGERFRPSPQAADPRMRRLKNRQTRLAVESTGRARSDQSEVWREVADRSAEMASASPTGAMSDIYERHRSQLAEITGAIPLHDGQCGSVAVIGGRIAILDFVGRGDVYAALHPAIVEGYALDALAHRQRSEDGSEGEADASTVNGFTLLVGDSPAAPDPSGPGLGATARFSTGAVEGSALIHEGELVQLTAYPSDADVEPSWSAPRAHRVSRPSRRSGRGR